MNKTKLMFGLAIIFGLIFIIGDVSATTWTRSMDYSEKDLKVSFSNWWGIGAEQGSLTLKSHPSVDYVKRVGLGNQVTMYYDFTFNELIENGLGEVDFINMKTGKPIERDWKFVYKFEEERTREVCLRYEETKNDTKEDTRTLETKEDNCLEYETQTYTFSEWRDYNSRDIPKGDIRIGVMVNNKEGDYIDGIWNIGTKKIDKHAVWTASLETDLISYYKLDETTGAVVDSHGTNNGTNYGATRGVTGIINNAYEFDGNDDYVEIPHNTTIDFNGNSDFSISFWVKATSGQPLTKRQGNSPFQGYTFQPNLDRDFRVIGTNDEIFVTGGNYMSGNWHNVVGIFEASNQQISLYVDGTLIGIDSSANLGDVSNTNSLKLGAGYAGTNNNMDGTIDEVGMWSRALSSTEIEQLYNNGSGIEYGIKDLSITLLTPTNNTATNNNEVTFTANITDEGSLGIQNVSLVIDGTIEQTNTSGTEGEYSFTETLSDGNYEWYILAYDDNNESYYSDENRTLIVDTTDPVIIANLTQEIIYNYGDNITLNYDITDDNLDSCWYNYAGTNNTLNCSESEYNITSQEGYTEIIVYANDSVGNINSSEVLSFEYDGTPPTIIANLTQEIIYNYGDNITLNYDITDDNLDSCFYQYGDYGEVSDRPLNYYSFDRNNPFDTYGNNHGKIVGNVETGVTGKINDGYNFTGDGYVETQNFNGSDYVDGFSVSLWVNNPTNSQGRFFTAENLIFRYGNLGETEDLVIVDFGGGTTFTSGGGTFGREHIDQIVITYNSSDDEWNIYQNATNFRTFSYSFTDLGSFFKIGENWNGTIDEVSIYNKTLTPTEISNLYASGSANRPYEINATENINCAENQTNITSVEGYTDLAVYANDTIGNINSSEVLTFEYDSVAPTITINYPTALIDYGYEGLTLELNLTVNDTNLDSVWYDYNGTNVTISSPSSGVDILENITLESYSNRNITIYANDTVGNLNSSFIEWDYIIWKNNITFNSETIELATESFGLDINYTPGDWSSISGRLNYNGTNYSATTTTTSGNNVIFERNLEIPTVTTETNFSFFWYVRVTNSTGEYFITTETNTQTVRSVEIGNCSVYNNILYNFSLRDEFTRELITFPPTTNGIIETEVTLYGLGNGESITFNQRFEDDNNPQICLSDALIASNLYLDLEVKHYSDNHTTRYYHIENSYVNASSLNRSIDLYAITPDDSTIFSIYFRGRDFNPVSDALIQVSKKYISDGNFRTVEIPKTDVDGKTTASLVQDNQAYTFYIYKEGELQTVVNNVFAICENEITGDCRVNLNAFASVTRPESFLTKDDINYNVAYDETTRTITMSFSTITGDSSTMRLNVIKFDSWNNDTICDETLESSSGTLSCIVPETYVNSSVQIQLSKADSSGTTRPLSRYVINLNTDPTQIFGYSGYFLALIMIITIPFMFITSAIGMVIGIVIGIIALSLLLLSNGANLYSVSGGLMYMIIAATVLIWKLSSDRRNI